MQRIYNEYNTEQWDDIRDFLAVHYAFNTRLDTAFWRACRADTDLAGAAPAVEWYRENGPSLLVKGILVPEQNAFALEGFLTILVGMKEPHARVYAPPPAELKAWRDRCTAYGIAADRSLTVADCLGALRKAGWIK